MPDTAPDPVPVPHGDPLSIDEIIAKALDRCSMLPSSFLQQKQQISELSSRLAKGRLHLAVVGEFNRGKSTFINSLVGYDLLPTSVLPITSVPTHIIYGRDITCTVSFLNNKPAVTVTTSSDAVRNTLLKYVAEENNPNNQFGVRSVEVSVPAPLLENGTVLIDTPGFGSTYLHNTQTALGSLNDCDAVLFLLSVDPPITQTEIEFLKLVVTHVPRIFYILNKIDLVTGGNLEKVNRFAGDVITSKLHQTSRPHIFPISAKNAQFAEVQNIDDLYWKRSGMEVVKNDIISFLAREKYFTLSQALNDKLREAVESILTVLKREKDRLESPLAGLNSEKDAILGVADAVKATLERELAIVNAEKKAIVKFFDESLSAGRLKLIRQVHETVAGLLNGSTCSAESLRSVTMAVNRVLPEALNTFKTRILAALNRPLKRAVLLHGKEYSSSIASMLRCISEPAGSDEKRFGEKLDSLEISPEERPEDSSGQLPALTFKLLFSDHFFGREKKIKRLHTRYDHLIDDIVKNDLFAFSKHIRGKIDALFSSLTTLLTTDYQQIIQRLSQFAHHKEEAMADHTSRHAAELESLSRNIRSFEEIIAHLNG